MPIIKWCILNDLSEKCFNFLRCVWLFSVYKSMLSSSWTNAKFYRYHKVLIKNVTLRLPSVHIDEANKHFSHSLFYSKGFAGSNLVKSNLTIVPLLRESFYHWIIIMVTHCLNFLIQLTLKVKIKSFSCSLVSAIYILYTLYIFVAWNFCGIFISLSFK